MSVSIEEMVSFNINNYVHVVLNEVGFQALADRHNKFIGTIPNWEYRSANYFKEKQDKKGYTSFQLWEFMQEFGNLIGITKTPPCAMDIYFKKSDLKEQ